MITQKKYYYSLLGGCPEIALNFVAVRDEYTICCLEVEHATPSTLGYLCNRFGLAAITVKQTGEDVQITAA